MSKHTIIAALSLLATGSLAVTGCDKDRPVTEVPAAAPEPKKAKPKKTKPKKRRARARASKGEAACGEGTCA